MKRYPGVLVFFGQYYGRCLARNLREINQLRQTLPALKLRRMCAHTGLKSFEGEILDEEPLRWVIAQTKPNGHRIAEENLRRQGFVTFLPMIEETRRRGTRFVRQKAPVFPGYVFVAFEPGAMRWHAINATKGVTKLVALGPKPAEVPASVIAALRDRFDEGLDMPDADLAEGDAVRVGAGPFMDLAGEIESVEPNARIWILLDVLGRTTRVSLSSHDVRKS